MSSIEEFRNLSGDTRIVAGTQISCWELVRPWEFVKKLTSILRPAFIVPKNHRLINQGFETPSVGGSSISWLWARFDTNRNPSGWFAFVQNTWKRFYTDSVGVGEMRWIYGDSENPPEGWQPLLSGLNDIDPAILAKLREMYVEITPNRYSYFAARYIGY